MSVPNPLDGLPAEAKARLRTRAPPKWVAPMLATLTDDVCSRQGWLFEPKWDGERCLAFRRGRVSKSVSGRKVDTLQTTPKIVVSKSREVPTICMSRLMKSTTIGAMAIMCLRCCPRSREARQSSQSRKPTHHDKKISKWGVQIYASTALTFDGTATPSDVRPRTCSDSGFR
jgi:hypothetical protein